MTRNWFEQGGGNDAAHRPDYPAELGAELARIAPRRGTAVDVGCGTGQLTGLLAEHFTHVIGVDPGAASTTLTGRRGTRPRPTAAPIS